MRMSGPRNVHGLYFTVMKLLFLTPATGCAHLRRAYPRHDTGAVVFAASRSGSAERGGPETRSWRRRRCSPSSGNGAVCMRARESCRPPTAAEATFSGVRDAAPRLHPHAGSQKDRPRPRARGGVETGGGAARAPEPEALCRDPVHGPYRAPQPARSTSNHVSRRAAPVSRDPSVSRRAAPVSWDPLEGSRYETSNQAAYGGAAERSGRRDAGRTYGDAPRDVYAAARTRRR